jgi:hypothetical protein
MRGWMGGGGGLPGCHREGWGRGMSIVLHVRHRHGRHSCYLLHCMPCMHAPARQGELWVWEGGRGWLGGLSLCDRVPVIQERGRRELLWVCQTLTAH